MKRFILITFLIIFIIIDSILLLKYFQKDSNVKTFISPTGKNYFTTNIKSIKGSNMNFNSFELFANIYSRPYYDNGTKNNIVKLIVKKDNNTHIVNLILGPDKRKVLVSFAKKGVLNSEIGSKAWKLMNVENIINYLKKQYPIIITFEADKNIENKIKNNKNCNELCKKYIYENAKYNSLNIMFIDQINKGTLIKNVNLGYPTTIILYE